MEKAGFNSKIPCFFSNYLIDRKTQYWWNNLTSPYFSVDVGIGQGSVLFPIVFTLYHLPIFHIFEKKAKNLKIPVSFVDNGFFISQEKSFEKINANIFCSYNYLFFTQTI